MPLQFKVLKSNYPVPNWWETSVEHVSIVLTDQVKHGKLTELAASPGGHPVYAVMYGEPEPEWKGTANFNSAIGAGKPEAYYARSKRRRPVLMVIAGIHGHEVEGTAAAMSLIHILETGKDASGADQSALADKLKRCRVIVVPQANPDGRMRMPYRGWIGLPQEEMTLRGQGCRKNGELYRWRGSKALHPMKGDVGLLGCYFDDAGINMMHDDWAAPMSAATRALLQLVAEEGPDCVINLHSHQHMPCLLQTEFVPLSHRQRVYDFAAKLYDRLDRAGLPHGSLTSSALRVAASEEHHSFNLQSMFYHVGAAFCLLFESTHGLDDHAEQFSYSDILNVHLHLFEESVDDLLAASRHS